MLALKVKTITTVCINHQPVCINHQPVCINHQPVCINHQPVCINHQPVCINHQPSTGCNTCNFKGAFCDLLIVTNGFNLDHNLQGDTFFPPPPIQHVVYLRLALAFLLRMQVQVVYLKTLKLTAMEKWSLYVASCTLGKDDPIAKGLVKNTGRQYMKQNYQLLQ